VLQFITEFQRATFYFWRRS